MTKGCRLLRRQLEKGYYGDSFHDLPREFSDHLNTCPECKHWIESLAMMEQAVASIPIEEIEPERLVRIRNGVLDAIAQLPSKTPWWVSLLKPVPAFGASLVSATAIILMIFLLHPTPDDPFKSEILNANKLEISEDVILANEALPEILDEQSVAALLFNNSELSEESEAIESNQYGPMLEWLYHQETASEFEELTDSDLIELRRYLS
jgi:hypothetical protein